VLAQPGWLALEPTVIKPAVASVLSVWLSSCTANESTVIFPTECKDSCALGSSTTVQLIAYDDENHPLPAPTEVTVTLYGYDLYTQDQSASEIVHYTTTISELNASLTLAIPDDPAGMIDPAPSAAGNAGYYFRVDLPGFLDGCNVEFFEGEVPDLVSIQLLTCPPNAKCGCQ
jgi:hypothetical protein